MLARLHQAGSGNVRLLEGRHLLSGERSDTTTNERQKGRMEHKRKSCQETESDRPSKIQILSAFDVYG